MEETQKVLADALEYHKNGEADKAEACYKELIERKVYDKRIFVNLAAIIRSQGNPQDAAKVANDGLRLTDSDSPILLNTLANCLRDLKRYEEAINMYRRAIKGAPDYFDPKFSITVCLWEAGYKTLSDLALRSMVAHYGFDNKLLINHLIVREVEKATDENRYINSKLGEILEKIDRDREEMDNQALPHHWFTLSQICLSNNKLGESIKYFHKAKYQLQKTHEVSSSSHYKEKADLLNTVSSWNFGCQLIRHGEFELGWKLYDYGLRTPADGKQRWQRSLYKPFSFTKIKLWKGEGLKNKRLLLLGEQGIGDSMMFITLIPVLQKEGAKITLVVPDRLKEIYKRSFTTIQVITDDECRKKAPKPEAFDYQCPLGSIVQHRFSKLEDFKNKSFKLKADKNKVFELRKKYLKGSDYKLIGISWQGGGTKERINSKSIKLKELLLELKKYKIKIVSLQYGDDAEAVKEHAEKLNVDFVDDESIQATKNMNAWLNQVDSCDGIISIANTTIHGAGGLKKPTLCLLGNKSDWRWLADREQKNSYWYPDVEIAWQDELTSKWDSALGLIGPWLKKNKLIETA